MTSYEDHFQEAENHRQNIEEKRKGRERRVGEKEDRQRKNTRLHKNEIIYKIIERYDSEIREILVAYHKVHFANCCHDAEINLNTKFDEENRIVVVFWNLPYCKHGIHYASVSIHLNLGRTLFSKAKVKGFRIAGTDNDIQTSLFTKELVQAMAGSRPKWIEDLLRDGG